MSAGKAYLSTADRTGVAEFAEVLNDLGHELFASDGTRHAIEQNGLHVVKTPFDLIGPGEIAGKPTTELNKEFQASIIAGLIATGDIDLVYVTLTPVATILDKHPISHGGTRRRLDRGGLAMLAAGADTGRVVVSNADQLDEVATWLIAGKPQETTFLEYLANAAYGEIAQHADEARKVVRQPQPTSFHAPLGH